MKKNRMMRLASILLVCVLLSTSVISGTFAKYISTASDSDSARVAKWEVVYSDKVNGGEGVDISTSNVISFDLFNTVFEEDATSEEVHVAKGTDVMIIAPGTGGKFSFTVTNNSEVDASIDLVLTESEHGLPIEYSLDGKTYYDGFSKINSDNTDIELKYVGGGTVEKEITVYWRWAFIGTESTNFTATQTDETDTAAGIAAQDFAQAITITATLTATQID